MISRFKPVAILLVTLVAACSNTAPTQERPESAAQSLDGTLPAHVAKVDAPGIENFSRVDGTEGIGGAVAGFGGATQPTAMVWLKSAGFASVINLRLATEEGATVDASRAAAEAAGLKYIHLPFNAADPDPQIVDNFVAAVGDPANQPVYIHCRSATRVAGLWMITRVREDGWEIEQASEEAEAIAGKPEVAIGFATKYLVAQKSE